MDVEFLDRAAAWRPRGRPATPVDPDIVRTLRRTYTTRTAAVVQVAADTPIEDVRRTLTQLQRAAGSIGKHLRVQPRRARDIIAAGVLRFYVEDVED